jgi:hypothetical protein
MNRTNVARLHARIRNYALKLASEQIRGLPRLDVLPEDRAEVLEAYRTAKRTDGTGSTDACVYCRSTRDLGVDFLVPLNRDGTAHPENLVPACARCIKNRRSRHLDEWFEHRLDLDTRAIYARIAEAHRVLRSAHTVPLREAA